MTDLRSLSCCHSTSETLYDHRWYSQSQRSTACVADSCPVNRISTCLIGADVSPESVVSMIRKLCRSGYRLSEKKVMSRDRRLYDAAIEHFGTWSQTLTESGVNPDNIRMIWNNAMSQSEQLVDELRTRHSLGKSLALRVVSRENFGLAESVRSVFGSWSRGLLAAGLIDSSELGRAICLEQQQVIDAICERHKAGQSLLTGTVQREHRVLLLSARHYFRTWKEAVEVAMLEIQEQPLDD